MKVGKAAVSCTINAFVLVWIFNIKLLFEKALIFLSAILFNLKCPLLFTDPLLHGEYEYQDPKSEDDM